MAVELEVLPQWQGFFQDATFKAAYSGRGAGKSTAAIIAMLYFGSRATMRILCLREFMSDLSQSVKAEIEYVIELSGTQAAWKITDKEIRHKKTGTVIHFRGMNKMFRSIKSLSQYNLAFIDEAEDVTKESWDILVPTIRSKQGFEIWCCWNPKDENSVMAQTFVENEPPPDSIVMTSDYRQNPHLDKKQVRIAEHLKATNPDLYEHVWLGGYLTSGNTTMVHNCAVGEAQAFPHDAVITGVDVAEEGGDRTVFVTRKGRTILDVTVFDAMNQDLLVAELRAYEKKWRPERINLDSTGFGHYAVGMLRQAGIEVFGENFAESARDEDKYHNRRTELCGLAVDFFAGGGMIPSHYKELALEVQLSTYTLDNKRRFQLKPKKLIRKKTGKSPDIADAFFLSLYNPYGMFASSRAQIVEAQELQISAKMLINASKWG